MNNYSTAESIGFKLYKTTNSLKNKFSKKISKYEITPEQFGTLMVIEENPESTLTKIAEIFSKDKATISRVIKSLEVKRYVKRVSCREDKRAYKISLTQDGLDMLNRIKIDASQMNSELKEKIGMDLDKFETTMSIVLEFSKEKN